MSNERRQHYRVSPTTGRDVTVSIRLASGQESRAVLIDISAGGAAVAFARADAPTVTVADLVSVIFQSERLGEPLAVSGYVRRIKLSTDHENILFGVVFDEWDTDRSDLTPKLRALFNEREAVRVEPREDEEVDIEVVLTGKASRVDGTLRDISVLGMGMWVSVDDHPDLEDGSTIQVDLTLPNGEQAMKLDVEVRHIEEFGERARVGLRFGREANASTSDTQRDITQYVMARQIEVARVDAERRRAMEDHYSTG